MGRGDKRTEKGKRARGSYGKYRNKASLKARARAAKAAPPKQEEQKQEKQQAPAEATNA